MGTSAFGQNAPEGWPLHNRGRAHVHWEWGRDYTQARSAEDAFTFLEKNNLKMVNDGKENIVDDYCALTVAAELYKATKKEQYKQAAVAAPKAWPRDWCPPGRTRTIGAPMMPHGRSSTLQTRDFRW